MQERNRAKPIDWTKEPPSEAGWYWCKDYFHSYPTIVCVNISPDVFDGAPYVKLGARTRAEDMDVLWWPERINEPPLP